MAAWKKVKDVQFEDQKYDVHLFMRACDSNDIFTVKRYIRHGIDPNWHEGDFKTGLHIAADNNYYNLVKILLDVPKININARNDWGCTPLYQACARSHINIVLLLIKKGADVNIPHKHGYTPLHNSVLLRHTKVVKILLEHKAEVNSANDFGKTPLHLAVLDSPDENIVDLLVKYGANVNVNNGVAMPILIEGALSCQSIPELETIIHFVSFGADINISDRISRRTPLHMVAISNYVPLAEFLVNNGARLEQKDMEYKTPLDIAKRHHNTEMIEFLKCRIMMETDEYSVTDFSNFSRR